MTSDCRALIVERKRGSTRDISSLDIPNFLIMVATLSPVSSSNVLSVTPIFPSLLENEASLDVEPERAITIQPFERAVTPKPAMASLICLFPDA